MPNPQLGDVGEDLAAVWASQAGFTVTQVRRDRHGWDHLIEFSGSRPNSDSGPLGLDQLDFSAKLQVKTTRSRKRVIPIKLSNWRRAIDDVLPWFFLVVRVHKTRPEPVEVALIHLGKDLIEAVLHRIYRLPQSKRTSLHKYVMSLSWTNDDVLERPFDVSLRSAVYSAVGNDPFSYSQQKRTWYDSAGMAEASINGTFEVHAQSEDELYRRLARAAVGLDGTLQISRFAVVRTRFGVAEADTRLPSEQGGRLSIGPGSPQKKWTLIVSHRSGSQAVALEGLARFSASVFPALPKKFWILRFQTPLLDLVIEVGTGRFDLRVQLSPDERSFPIHEFGPSFRFLKLLHEARENPLLFQLKKDDRHESTPFATIRSTIELGPELLILTQRACAISALAHDLGADLKASFQLSEIYDIAPLAEFMLAARRRTEIHVRAEYSVPEQAIDVKEPVAVVTNPSLRIGNLTYVEILCYRGTLVPLSTTAGESRVRIVGSSPRTLESFELSGSQARTFEWEKALSRAAAALESEGIRNVFVSPWK